MKDRNKIVMAVLGGLAIGAALGVLFAPDKGSEIRKKISDAAKKFADKLKEQI